MGWLWDDWLKRVHAQEVDLESSDFEERYELRAAPDQDPMVLHELFSPSFIVSATPLARQPGCLRYTCAICVASGLST